MLRDLPESLIPDGRSATFWDPNEDVMRWWSVSAGVSKIGICGQVGAEHAGVEHRLTARVDSDIAARDGPQVWVREHVDRDVTPTVIAGMPRNLDRLQ